MSTPRWIAGCIVVVFALLLARSAESAPILYKIEGSVGMSLGPTIPVGAVIEGTLVYDPDATRQSTGPNYAYFSSGVSLLSVTVGGISFGGPTFNQLLSNDQRGNFGVIPSGIHDSFSVSYRTTSLYLLDTDATLFNTFTNLPAQLPLDEFEYAVLSDGTTDREFAGLVSISRVTPVPEPASLLFVGTGLIGFAARYRRRGVRPRH